MLPASRSGKIRTFARPQNELHDHVLGAVLAVAVLDGIDDRLADGHAYPMRQILVEAGNRRESIAEHLDQVEQLKRTGQLEADQMVVSQHDRGVSNILS